MLDALLEKDLLPDWLVRVGIRRLLAQRIREETAPTEPARQARMLGYVADLKTRPIAEDTGAEEMLSFATSAIRDAENADICELTNAWKAGS